eukprot:TRINITY_DN34976_c0_g1_i1.p1 TRINITY_DN34976_c0_g1~~TRINITY_DN34976_c0_g1_i1.p1  ORF type:complete len:333 (-),score=19.39 TRINITY_DN34976_c0_g1_i1:31-885(-)
MSPASVAWACAALWAFATSCVVVTSYRAAVVFAMLGLIGVPVLVFLTLQVCSYLRDVRRCDWLMYSFMGQGTLAIDPRHLKYSQDSIKRQFLHGPSAGKDVHTRIDCHPLKACVKYRIEACFHCVDGKIHLFAINNRTLFNAKYNKVPLVLLTIKHCPGDWSSRFTAQPPYKDIFVRGRGSLPHEPSSARSRLFARRATATREDLPQGEVRLCVMNLIKEGDGETVIGLLKQHELSRDINVQKVEGDHAEISIRVSRASEDIVCSIIQKLGDEHGVQPIVLELK